MGKFGARCSSLYEGSPMSAANIIQNIYDMIIAKAYSIKFAIAPLLSIIHWFQSWSFAFTLKLLPSESRSRPVVLNSPSSWIWMVLAGVIQELVALEVFPQGKVPLLSLEGLHQLHIFIFLLEVVHMIFSATIVVLGRAKILHYKHWEYSTRRASQLGKWSLYSWSSSLIFAHRATTGHYRPMRISYFHMIQVYI